MEHVEEDRKMSTLEETEIRKQCVEDIINIIQDSNSSEKEDHLQKVKKVFAFKEKDSSNVVLLKVKTVLKQLNKETIILYKKNHIKEIELLQQ